MSGYHSLPLHTVIVTLASSIWHLETLRDKWDTAEYNKVTVWSNSNEIPLYAHLSTEPQPLIGGLYVVCYHEEHLIALRNTIRSRQKVKRITPWRSSILLGLWRQMLKLMTFTKSDTQQRPNASWFNDNKVVLPAEVVFFHVFFKGQVRKMGSHSGVWHSPQGSTGKARSQSCWSAWPLWAWWWLTTGWPRLSPGNLSSPQTPTWDKHVKVRLVSRAGSGLCLYSGGGAACLRLWGPSWLDTGLSLRGVMLMYPFAHRLAVHWERGLMNNTEISFRCDISISAKNMGPLAHMIFDP